MSNLEKKSVYNIILNYSTVLISVLATLFIYPLDMNLYGLIQKILANALLLSAFLSFGSYAIVTKYYPYFQKQKAKGFFLFVLTTSLSVSLIVSCIYFLLYYINSYYSFFEINFTIQELIYVYVLGFILSILAILRSYSFNLKKINIPDILTIISIKIFVPILILISFTYSLSQKFSTLSYLLFYILIAITLTIYLRYIDKDLFFYDKFKLIKKKKLLEIIRYMLYSGLNHAGNILAYKIDLIIIGLFLKNEFVGYYSTFLFMALLIEIPTKSILQITGPVISEYLESNYMDKVNRIYKKTSLNLFLLGTFVFGILLINIDLLFIIMKNGHLFSPFKYLFIFLGIAKLVDMITSVNSSIIAYSKYYKYNSLFLLTLTVINISLSYYLLNYFGIIGVGIATLVSVTFFNLLKSLFIYKKFNLHPFSTNHLYPISIFLLSFGLYLWEVTSINIWIINIFKSIVLTIMFYLLIIRKNISPDLNNMLNKFISKNNS